MSKTARDFFNERLNAEKQVNPTLTRDVDDSWRIYLCGWEDGVRNYINEINEARRNAK